MSLSAVFKNKSTFSIELCPSKKTLNLECLKDLKKCDFISIVWLEKENPTKELTFALCKQLVELGYPVLLHLAGKDLNRNECLQILSRAKEIGVKNILALQGDPLRIKDGGDFPYAANLVAFIRENFGGYFVIGVAGYPAHVENHQSMIYLKNKIDNGANFILTQATFQYEKLEEFCIECRELGINQPIICGLFMINSFKTYEIIHKQCKIQVADKVDKIIQENKDNDFFIKQYGLDLCKEFVNKVNSNADVKGIHIFCLNDLSSVCELTNLAIPNA